MMIHAVRDAVEVIEKPDESVSTCVLSQTLKLSCIISSQLGYTTVIILGPFASHF